MWQEILAIDSHFSKLRTVETQNVSLSQQPPLSILPSLYLKRRLQLLQVQPTKTPPSPMDKMECSNERDEATFVTHRPGKQTLEVFSKLRHIADSFGSHNFSHEEQKLPLATHQAAEASVWSPQRCDVSQELVHLWHTLKASQPLRLVQKSEKNMFPWFIYSFFFPRCQQKSSSAGKFYKQQWWRWWGCSKMCIQWCRQGKLEILNLHTTPRLTSKPHLTSEGPLFELGSCFSCPLCQQQFIFPGCRISQWIYHSLFFWWRSQRCNS